MATKKTGRATTESGGVGKKRGVWWFSISINFPGGDPGKNCAGAPTEKKGPEPNNCDIYFGPKGGRATEDKKLQEKRGISVVVSKDQRDHTARVKGVWGKLERGKG